MWAGWGAGHVMAECTCGCNQYTKALAHNRTRKVPAPRSGSPRDVTLKTAQSQNGKATKAICVGGFQDGCSLSSQVACYAPPDPISPTTYRKGVRQNSKLEVIDKGPGGLLRAHESVHDRHREGEDS